MWKMNNAYMHMHKYLYKGPRRMLAALAVMLVAALALAPSLALACAKDGVPSVSANGRLAVLNRSSQRIVVTTWSPFVFSGAVARTRVVVLAENNREVARALPRDVFSHPWRWDFGDRSKVVFGATVRHAYKKAGSYRIEVMAYYPLYGAWQPFDFVTIHVK